MKQSTKYILLFILSSALTAPAAFAAKEDNGKSGKKVTVEALAAESAARAAADTDLAGLINTISLTPGPQGNTGAVGPQGPIGENGANGAQGAMGPQGAIGPQGDTGATGQTGATGAQGPAGQVGVNGAQGKTGAQGQAGPQGEIGAMGETGATGRQGEAGLQGQTGAIGQVGPEGPAGQSGAIGAEGSPGDDGLQGPQGEPGINADGSELFARLAQLDRTLAATEARLINSDFDLDGYTPAQGDCDDADSLVHPGAYPNDCGITYYVLGQAGPAGGIVFYVTEGGLHGLEASPQDVGVAEWGCENLLIPGATGETIGTGAKNTRAILDACDEPNIAARVADNYVLGDFDDWFLPSKDELGEFYFFTFGNINTVDSIHWTSNQDTSVRASIYALVWISGTNYNQVLYSRTSRVNPQPFIAIREF